MTTEQLQILVLGPMGLLVASLYLNWSWKKDLDKFRQDLESGTLVPRERLDEMRKLRDEQAALAERSLRTNESITSGLAERNQRLEDGLSQDMTRAQDRIATRPRPRS